MFAEQERDAFFMLRGPRSRGEISLIRLVIYVMPTRVGDFFTLPSGRVAQVKFAPESRRPWHVMGRGSNARVCRAHSDPAALGIEFYSELGTDEATIFDECDAK